MGVTQDWIALQVKTALYGVPAEQAAPLHHRL